MNVTTYWYNNSVLHLTADYNGSYANGTLFNATLANGNTTKTHQWTCGLRLFDGVSYTSANTTYNVTILNTAPTVSLSLPADASTTTDRTPLFQFSVSDADAELVRWEFNTTLVANSTCTDTVEMQQARIPLMG